MPVAANSSVFIYAKDRHRLARFYKSVLGFVLLEESDDSAILQSGSLQAFDPEGNIFQLRESVTPK
jgi:hypothetical protein